MRRSFCRFALAYPFEHRFIDVSCPARSVEQEKPYIMDSIYSLAKLKTTSIISSVRLLISL